MKKGTIKFLTSVFVLLLTFSISIIPIFGVEKVNATEENSWTTLAPLPTQEDITTIGAAAVDGKIYFIGWNAYEKYDPETDTWTTITPLPIYNGWGTVVACQNKIYVIGGNAEDPTQVYDPATDTWENRTSIPTTRLVQQANVVDGKIYVIGGQIPSPLGVVNPSSANDVYDPETDSWSKKAPIPTPVMGYASAVLDKKIYIIGGGIPGGAPDFNSTNEVQIFDPKTNEWTNGPSIPTGVAFASACATTGLFAPKRIYVVGGTLIYNWNRYPPPGTDLNQVYDPETGNWAGATSMPTGRYELTLVNVDDELYAIGGNYYGDVLANEKYTPIDYIPEFPPWIILPIFATATLFALIIKKKLFR